mmetsp:Transcript_3741/g.7819  ORF Transcript_3741/g.7819 Transcript_3741/m.7819 type:complete len:231 (-) Transcript_3741:828-1520(-)
MRDSTFRRWVRAAVSSVRIVPCWIRDGAHPGDVCGNFLRARGRPRRQRRRACRRILFSPWCLRRGEIGLWWTVDFFTDARRRRRRHGRMAGIFDGRRRRIVPLIRIIFLMRVNFLPMVDALFCCRFLFLFLLLLFCQDSASFGAHPFYHSQQFCRGNLRHLLSSLPLSLLKTLRLVPLYLKRKFHQFYTLSQFFQPPPAIVPIAPSITFFFCFIDARTPDINVRFRRTAM